MFWTLLLLRYMHILGAITLMGGTIFAYFAASPGLAEMSEGDRTKAHAAIRARWNKFVMLATLLLLVSGLANMILTPRNYDLGDMKSAYSMWTGIKLVLALPIFYFAALLTGRSPLAQKIQANAKTYMALNLVLALSMVLIGGALRLIDRQPKDARPAQTTPAAQETFLGPFSATSRSSA
jgi:uncharacterized membrane protein